MILYDENQDIFSKSAAFKYKTTMETINTTILRMARRLSVCDHICITHVGGM